MTEYDVVIVGGGLQGTLLQMAFAHYQPHLRLAVIEREAALGGNHTWCFHADDLTPHEDVFAELVEYSWPSHEVRFLNQPTRIVDSPYRGFTDKHLDRVARKNSTHPTNWLLETHVVSVEEQHVVTDSTTVRGRLIIDTRPPARPTDGCGFQKFVGVELELAEPHGFDRPVLMDAHVSQHDGFRFVYVLPFTTTRLLIEDTYFSDTPTLHAPLLQDRVRRYAADKKLKIKHVVRTEEGVLPMPWRSSPTLLASPFAAGYRGGWFHPATGYSLPVASRLACALAQDPVNDFPGPRLVQLYREHEKQFAFAKLLNRLAFRWVAPAERWRLFERFYRLPDETIRRFYALKLTRRDQLRLLLGKPPSGFSLRSRWRDQEAIS